MAKKLKAKFAKWGQLRKSIYNFFKRGKDDKKDDKKDDNKKTDSKPSTPTTSSPTSQPKSSPSPTLSKNNNNTTQYPPVNYDLNNRVNYISSMFPEMKKDKIEHELKMLGGDVNKTIDSLLDIQKGGPGASGQATQQMSSMSAVNNMLSKDSPNLYVVMPKNKDKTDTQKKYYVANFEKSCPYFYGKLTSQEAEAMLKGKPEGTFVLRYSSQSGHIAISYVLPNGAIDRGLIGYDTAKFWMADDPNEHFEVLQDLVQSRNAFLTIPLSRDSPTTKKEEPMNYGVIPRNI